MVISSVVESSYRRIVDRLAVASSSNRIDLLCVPQQLQHTTPDGDKKTVGVQIGRSHGPYISAQNGTVITRVIMFGNDTILDGDYSSTVRTVKYST